MTRIPLALSALAATFLMLSLPSALPALDWVGANPIMNPRAMGMGGAFSAVANDDFALYSNPAGLLHNPKANRDKDDGIITVMEMGFHINKDLQTLSKFYQDNKDSLGDPSSLPANELDKVLGRVAGLGAQGPIHLNYVGHGWGVGLVDTIDVEAVTGRDAPTPLLHLSGVAHTSLVGGYALPLSLGKKDDLWLGFAGKVFARGDMDKEVSLFELSGIADIQDEFTVSNGVGIDIGTLYHVNNSWDIAVSVRDLPTVVTKSVFGSYGLGSTRKKTVLVKPNLVTGFAYRPDVDFLHKYVPPWLMDDPVLAVDYAHYFDNRYSLFTRLHMGVEFASIFHRLFVRFGINQGYFTYGLGLDLFVLHVNYVHYRRELGVYPGEMMEESDYVSFAVKF